jgi:hypothetical protein
VSEKCLGAEVPADCKSVRIGLMVSQACNENNLLYRKGPGVYEAAHPGVKSEIPDKWRVLGC